MAIIKNKKLDRDLERRIYNEALKEFKKVQSIQDVNNFLDKFMTTSEKAVFIRRLAIAGLLEEGRSYRKIEKLLEVSRGTISNIKDIVDGRGYGRNPNRKRKYSEWKTEKKFKNFKRKYKGAASIIDLI